MLRAAVDKAAAAIANRELALTRGTESTLLQLVLLEKPGGCAAARRHGLLRDPRTLDKKCDLWQFFIWAPRLTLSGQNVPLERGKNCS